MIMKSTFRFFQDYQQLAQGSPLFIRRMRILNIHIYFIVSELNLSYIPRKKILFISIILCTSMIVTNIKKMYEFG